MITRISTKSAKVASGITLEHTPSHSDVPSGGLHHLHHSSAAAAAAATAAAAITAAAAEANDHRQNHCGGEVRLSEVEPVGDLVGPCFRRKDAVEPRNSLAGEVFQPKESFLQLLHYVLHNFLDPHLS
ncbi:hypothetical protein MIMGU_mgv1a016293mg [Erythranthe guttata]|uniref:Uncharacterized protein n=1 Tax=Erythranthe guttata TaxID=4155 RepID=A0A022QJJ8_ERYGU|nr:hypothetical protein MIMGU_mgv1a016293mg [Erythranthe guttata]